MKRFSSSAAFRKLALVAAAVLSCAAGGAQAAYTTGASAASVPAGYIACATDGKNCTVPSTATNVSIYYGADKTYATFAGSGNFTCSPSGLNNIADPASGKAKICWVKATGWTPAGVTSVTVIDMPSTGYTNCAAEGKNCAATGNWTGFYGASGKFFPIAGSGAFTCSLAALYNIADPAPGVAKSCHIAAATTTASPAPAPAPSPALATAVPGGFTACGVDGAKCAATGNWTGYYGTSGKFAQIKGSGEFVCLPNTLGVADPAQGVQKTCYVSNANLPATTTTTSTTTAAKPAAAPVGYKTPNTAVRGQACTWAAAEYCFMLRDRLYPYVGGLANSMGAGTKDPSNGKIIATMIQNYTTDIGKMPPDVYSMYQSNPAVPDVAMTQCRNNINSFNTYIKGFTQFAPSARFTPPAAPLTVTLTAGSCVAGLTATGTGLPTPPPNP